MIIIRRLLVLLFIISVGMIANADDKKFKLKNNTYSSTGRVNTNSSALEVTPFEWIDSKGNKYPIYISNFGSCYIFKTNSKTGKEYKQYLSPDISKDICAKLGKEYKSKKK